MTVSKYNEASLNQQAMKIINQHQIPFDPTTELAELVLIREALTQNLLEPGPIQEPTVTDSETGSEPTTGDVVNDGIGAGGEFEMELSENLPEAAAQILEEIVASLRATVPPMLL